MTQLESLFQVTGVQSGQRFRVDQHGPVYMVTVADNVTSGGTTLLQTSVNGTTWTTRATRVITANGMYSDVHHEPTGETPWARARLDARTDGTFTCYLLVGGGKP